MLYIGVSGFHPLQAFGLQLPQATFDQPKTYIRLFKSIDTKFDSPRIL